MKLSDDGMTSNIDESREQSKPLFDLDSKQKSAGAVVK